PGAGPGSCSRGWSSCSTPACGTPGRRPTTAEAARPRRPRRSAVPRSRSCAGWRSAPTGEFTRMDRFQTSVIDTGETEIFLRHGGSGPPVALLHGFPQTHLMWRDLAPRLAERFTVHCLDLRGYGRSGCPPSSSDHAAYAKRALGRDVVAVMRALGHERFGIVGHDRGGRVAYRTALDHPDRVAWLVVLDILPIDVSWDRADARLALGFWPWALLAQPEPLPERLLLAAPEAVVDHALGGAPGLPGGVERSGPRARDLRGVPGRRDGRS